MRHATCLQLAVGGEPRIDAHNVAACSSTAAGILSAKSVSAPSRPHHGFGAARRPGRYPAPQTAAPCPPRSGASSASAAVRASSSASMAVAAAGFRAKVAGQPAFAGERTAGALDDDGRGCGDEPRVAGQRAPVTHVVDGRQCVVEGIGRRQRLALERDVARAAAEQAARTSSSSSCRNEHAVLPVAHALGDPPVAGFGSCLRGGARGHQGPFQAGFVVDLPASSRAGCVQVGRRLAGALGADVSLRLVGYHGPGSRKSHPCSVLRYAAGVTSLCAAGLPVLTRGPRCLKKVVPLNACRFSAMLPSQ